MIYVPPKRRAIHPRCDRCGKLKWSMGSHLSAVGAACCCGGGCPSSMDVTFSSVDASRCTGCYDEFGNGLKFTVLNIDGTHTVGTFTEESDPDCGNVCEHAGEITLTGYFEREEYISDTSCSGSPDQTEVDDGLYIRMRLSTSTPRTVIEIAARSGSAGYEFFYWHVDDDASYSCASPPSLGTSLDNQLSTCSRTVAATGGTASVAAP